MNTLILGMFTSFSLLAWGATGHRIVGEIASKHLTKKAATTINRILDGESLARVSNWPDKIKSDPEKYGHTFSWHYTDWPTKKDKYNFKNNSGSLIQAIKDHLTILKNKKSPKKMRAEAISYITHLVGDLHQPLHVGNGIDRGGNFCQVSFHKERMNLHQLWDEGMIRFTKLSFTEYASFLEVMAQKEKKSFQKGDLLTWAKESKEARELVYPKAKIKKNGMRQYCHPKQKVAAKSIPKLGYQYSYKFLPILEKRLAQAGVRLAYLLNQSL